MSQITKSDCIEVGYIQKPHGLKGELVVVFDKEFAETFEEVELLLVEVDGGLVPFFIEDEGWRFKSDESAICRLGFVDSLNKAKEMVGCKVYVFDQEVIDSQEQGATSILIGMTAFDEKFGEIGLISRVDDFSGNVVITVDRNQSGILIPLSDNVIVSVDEDKREIHLSCPNGLIEMYLE